MLVRTPQTGGPSPIGSLSFNPNLLMADGEFVPDKVDLSFSSKSSFRD